MPELTDIRVHLDALVEQPFFRVKTGVTHEERAHGTVLHEYDERVLVHIIRSVLERRPAWYEECQLYPIVIPGLMTCWDDDRHARKPRRRKRIIIIMTTVHLPAIRNPAHRHHPQNSGGAANVIALGSSRTGRSLVQRLVRTAGDNVQQAQSKVVGAAEAARGISASTTATLTAAP